MDRPRVAQATQEGPGTGSPESESGPAAAAMTEDMSVSEFAGAIPSTAGIRLSKLALAHGFAVLLSLSMFGSADAWTAVSGLGIASLLGVLTGGIAGVVVANIIHEWFHLLGAVFTNARFTVPDKLGLFLYDWDFSRNNTRQFLVMSIAGTLGGVIAMILLFSALPADTWGRAAVLSGVIASFVFAGFIEWPVIYRTRRSGKPLQELATINERVLARSFTAASIALIVGMLVLAP